MIELLYYIKSEEYRNWLIENEKLLNQWDYLQIINAAQIDIRDKLRLLKKYKDELIKNGRITRRYDSACKCYEAAINLLLEESDVALFQVTLKRRRSTDDIEYTCDNTWPCKSFSEILEYTQERLDEGVTNDEFDDSWYVIERYTLRSGKYDLDAWFVMSSNGTVWCTQLYSESAVVSENHHNDRLVDMAGLHLPMPYKEGDIITIDCRPFHKPFHALITWSNDNMHNYSTCDCLCYTFEPYYDRVLSINSINHLYVGFDEFSPLINISKFKGELPQNEKIIKEVSRYIKTHEYGAHKIEDMHLGSDFSEFEEKLIKLISE
ncbi:MAG: hypothetical protein J6U00_05635 [Ruminococcus sp.]|uniref:hypothetical protein n=1 Tax=Ruminococcus sp. TaxID=41978 RepID=UPI001B1A4E0E|nr:hypothetical protein [Ruminococcus sp.]MBO7473470.1 hypothetical protein [Ruminococcus sp.]